MTVLSFLYDHDINLIIIKPIKIQKERNNL